MPRDCKRVKVGEDFRITVYLMIKKFCQTEDEKECVFPSSLTANERAYLHNYCHELGLKSKSRGQDANRYLTVYKKEGSTIVQADAAFQLGYASRKYALNLLQRFSVTSRERQELLPPTERDRICGQESIRDVNRSMGRLSSGIPMVPPCRCENEYTSFRHNLPIYNSREEIIQMISCHQTVLISGETGSGKTTQVPQYILEHHSAIKQPCRIICTEPRRIAALSIAERVATERGEKVGQLVGYQVRLEGRTSSKTLLTFCTTGVLLRTLMGGDASIATVTHIIVDELHERDKLSDFLLIVLRDLLLKFRNLKVILMSASVDTQLFSRYFSNCPVIEVPGRIFDVKTFFLEDVLKGTGYTNRAMIKHKNDIARKSGKIDSWCSRSRQVLDSSKSVKPQNVSSISSQISALDSYFENRLNINDDLSLNLSYVEPDHVELEPNLAAAMDELIENIWCTESNDFTSLLQTLLLENISVDYQHSETDVSPLMLAAGRGCLDVAEQLLALGASLHLKSSNGWTAIDWAKQFNHKEIEELLAGQWKENVKEEDTEENLGTYEYVPESEKIDQAGVSDDDKLLLEAYLHSINEDKIDYELIVCLLKRICGSQDEGAVLIFLPGYDDIFSLREKIIASDVSTKALLLILHSQIQSSEQRRVFRPAPDGLRKVVLATNIAETSITINDVVFVIDCGKVKEKTYDALTGSSQLKASWISKASAIQRRGRAGRCRPGLCYHMYSKARFNSFQKFQVPEILRVPIHELCLQAKLLAPPNAPIADFLAKAPEPPPFMVTRNAVSLLKTIDALDPWEELTELGLHLLDLPIEPRLGKMVLYSVVLKCLDPVLTIVCTLSYRDPFILPAQPYHRRAVYSARRDFSLDSYSDHMVLLQAFQGWQKARSCKNEYTFCRKKFLSAAVLDMIAGMRSQLLGQLQAAGFIKARGPGDMRDLNSNSDSWAVIKAALCAGTYPNLIRIDRDRQQLITQKESKVRFHHTSVLCVSSATSKHANAMHKRAISDMPCDWLIYEEMMRTGSMAHAHCCTLVSPITIALFAGPARLPLDALHEPDQGGYNEDEDSGDEYKYDNQKAMFKIDDWISFRIEPEMARLVLQVRQKWHALFLRRMHAPSRPFTPSDEAVIQTITAILVSEDVALNLLQPSGISQYPRSVDHFSPLEMQNNMYWDPNDMHTDYSYFNPSNVFDPNDESVIAACAGATNYNPSYSNSNPLPNCVNQSFSNSQQMFNVEMNSSKSNYYRVAYFMIKASTSRIVEVSMAENIWAFTPITERKVISAVKEGKDVILIFSIQGSGHFQGFARFTPHLADLCPPEFGAACFGPCYQIEWLRKACIPFQSTRHLQNAWNEYRKVHNSRGGQELEPSVGEDLCRLMVKAQSVLSMESLNDDNRRHTQMNYSREMFHGDSSPVNRSPMQWDMFNNSRPSFFGPSGKYWSPHNS